MKFGKDCDVCCQDVLKKTLLACPLPPPLLRPPSAAPRAACAVSVRTWYLLCEVAAEEIPVLSIADEKTKGGVKA